MTRLYLIDISTRSPSAAQTHITLVCELVAELLAARGLLNIHEGAFKDVLQCHPSRTRRPYLACSGPSQTNPRPDEKLSRCS